MNADPKRIVPGTSPVNQSIDQIYHAGEISVVVEDEHGNILYANPAAAALFEVSSASALLAVGSLDGFVIKSPRLGNAQPSRPATSLAHQQLHIRTLRGRTRIVLSATTPTYWDNTLAWQRILIDISEQASAAEALIDAERRWRDLLAGSLQGVVVHRDMHVLFANATAAKMLGYHHGDDLITIGDSLALIAPHDRARVCDYAQARVSGETAPEGYELDLLRRDGSFVRAEILVRTVNWDGDSAIQTTLVDITERHRAESELRASETRYRELAAAGNDFYWETDPDHRFVHASFTRMPGTQLERKCLLGKTRMEVACQTLAPASFEAHQHELNHGRPFRDFVYQVHPALSAGEELWLRVSGTPRFDDSGVFLGYRGTGANVTQEVQAQRRSRQAEQRLTSAMHSMSDGFALYDAHERLVDCNETYRHILGLEAEPLLHRGASFEDLVRHLASVGFYRGAMDDAEAWIQARIERFRSASGMLEIERRDGGWHQSKDHRCPDGSTIVLITDITELKRREEALAYSEDRFRDFLESASDWYWECDIEHRFTYLSARFEQKMGISSAQLLGRTRMQLEPEGADAKQWKQHIEDLKARRPFRGLTYWLRDPQGHRRYVRVSGVPVFDSTGDFKGYRGTGIDCTDEVIANATRQRYLEAIESISDGYALFDADDRLVEWNSAYTRSMHLDTAQKLTRGMPFSDIARLNLRNAIFPDAALDPENAYKERMRRHRECGAPFEICSVDGRWFQICDRRTPEGGVLVTTTEVTQLKRRENALRESEERFRNFAETAADWFFELDDQLKFNFASIRLSALTGIDVQTIVGEPFAVIATNDAQRGSAFHQCIDTMQRRVSVTDIEFEGVSNATQGIVHSVSALPIFGSDGTFHGYRGTGRDVTQSRRLATQLAYQASHDELTGLVNRREFERRLQHAIATADGKPRILCYLDLDQFKVVNDSCGHVAGDQLLRELAEMLASNTRREDTLARLGGDEFALLLNDCPMERAVDVMRMLRHLIDQYDFVWEGKRFRVSASAGMVELLADRIDVSDALRAADTACYLAKEQGRNRVHVYASEDVDIARREGELNWVTRTNKALAEDRLVLYAQPIVTSHNYPGIVQPTRFELLLRMIGDDGAIVAPGAFLPAAERYGLAARIDRWVVEAALRFLSSSRSKLGDDITLAINLSGQSIGDTDFHTFLHELLNANAQSCAQLCFEITETSAIIKLEAARKFMNSLRPMGCQFALDDFGTGLSSFAYLRTLPVDFLKIDGTFIRGIETDPVNYSIVRSINDIGQVLGKRTIAEYVEDAAAANALTELGVDFLQGFGIGKPAPLQQLLGDDNGEGPDLTSAA